MPIFPSPVPQGTREGIDQGYDWSAPIGSGIYAVAPGVISHISPPGSWAGGTGEAAYETLTTPVSIGGRSYPQVYYAEEHPLVHEGQYVNTGQQISVFQKDQSEIGFARGNQPASPRAYGNKWTQAGQDFAAALGFVDMPPDSSKPPPPSDTGTTPIPPNPAAVSDACKQALNDVISGTISTDQCSQICGQPCTTGGYPGGNIVGGITGAIRSVDDAVHFIFSLRFLEVLGGGLLILIAIRLLGNQLGATVRP
jgi:hypothetical protein